MNNDQRDIEEILSEQIRKKFLPRNDRADIERNKNLFETGIIDSAGLISFICFIEEEFDIIIPDEDLLPVNFMSVSAMAAYIRKRKEIIPVAIEQE